MVNLCLCICLLVWTPSVNLSSGHYSTGIMTMHSWLKSVIRQKTVLVYVHVEYVVL